MKNHITDVAGLAVGHASCDDLVSGATTVLFDRPAIGSIAVLGGAPAARDTECLAPNRAVEHIDGIVLSGGSGFGLDAATGVQAWLREQRRGLPVGGAMVPIVPQAICFDLLNGGNKDWGRYPPYRELGYAAAEAARNDDTSQGSIGGGAGATTVNFKGGIGAASARTSFGATVGALMLVNALGSATVGDGPHFWAAPYEQAGEFGNRGLPAQFGPPETGLKWKGGALRASGAVPPHSTTIGIIATDMDLTKAQAERLAIAAHDGFARALRLTHALFDGDILFAVSTRSKPASADPGALIELGGVAADCVARAIARAVFEAAVPSRRYIGPPAYQDVHGRDRPAD